MKILLLVPSLNAGGVETGTIDLSKALAKKGQEVIVVSSGGELVAELQKNEIKHIQLPINRKSLLTLLHVISLVKIIQEEHIELVHAQSRVPAWIAYLACKKTQTPFITSCHGYYSKHFLSSVMGRGEKVIVISKVIARHMRDSFGVPEEKIRLVYRGVDLVHYPYRSDKYATTNNTMKIVNIGRLTPIKGQREFIRAIDIVSKQISSLEVWLVGSGQKHKYERELQELVSELNLNNVVKFLGRRSDIPEILMGADLLVLSTQTPEAFGRVVIEAGATGTAVCASRIGGITEIIEDGKDGVLFDHDDEASMAKAILTCIQDRELLRRCSTNLRRKVQEEFSLDRMSEETLRIYKETAHPKHILVIKLGGLGDSILAVPSLRALRKQFHKSHISLLINSHFRPLFSRCPYVDEILLFDRKQTSILQLVSTLRKKEFDVSIDFKNNNFTHLLSFVSRVRHRYGFDKGILKVLLNNPVILSPEYQEGPIVQQARLLEALGVSNFDRTLELWTSSSNDHYVETLLKRNGVSETETLVGLAIGASKNWPTKNWPMENFIKLSEMLIRQGLKVVLLGQEHSTVRANEFPLDNNRINFVGKTDLTQFVALVKHVDILVTPDSAAMHVAAAFGIPIIALFGPTDPKKHIPPVSNIDVCVRAIECQPCYKRRCSYVQELRCLKEISVEEVFENVMKQLTGGAKWVGSQTSRNVISEY